MTVLLLAIAAGLQSPAERLPEANLNPHATELFERDPVLNEWALRLYDRNRDGWLTLYEAQPALQTFRDIADANRDGRVTVREYQAAKAYIAARWGAPRE